MKKYFIIFFISFSTIWAQTVFEPVDKGVYKFLEKLSSKGILEFHDLIKPVPRKYIAEKLLEAESKIDFLNALEKEELRFYKKDYLFEISFLNNNSEKHTSFFEEDPAGRFRVFSYSGNPLKIEAAPVLGFEYGTRRGESFYHLKNGISFSGYLKDYIGFKFNFWDNRESGTNINREKIFASETGIVTNSAGENFIEYANMNAAVSVDWKWGDFSVGQDFLTWGYGQSGKIVLSEKAPAFPFVRLNLYLNDWLDFNYFHAKLNSDIIDSTEIYPVPLSVLENRYLFREKYFVSHTLLISPLKGLQISLGESMVYSDRFEPVYLIPLIFFKTADHYLSDYDPRAGDNSQFFLSVSSKNHIRNTHLFATLFIDEITISKIFISSEQKNQAAFTFGFSTYDLLFNNFTLHSEYSRILPFVYSNFIPAQNFSNHNYPLGHWIGNNADIIYSELNYQFKRGTSIKVWSEYIRKGSEGSVEDQYSLPNKKFLFGDKTYFASAGLKFKFLPLHETGLEFNVRYNKSTKKFDNYNIGRENFWELSAKIYYGL